MHFEHRHAGMDGDGNKKVVEMSTKLFDTKSGKEI